MTTAAYNPYGKGMPTQPIKDYTFTGQIWPMKLVFFDLKRVTSSMNDSVYSEPLAFSANHYNNKIMQFYGDSFHVTRPGYNYTWSYGPADLSRMVVAAPPVNSELAKTYQRCR